MHNISYSGCFAESLGRYSYIINILLFCCIYQGGGAVSGTLKLIYPFTKFGLNICDALFHCRRSSIFVNFDKNYVTFSKNYVTFSKNYVTFSKNVSNLQHFAIEKEYNPFTYQYQQNWFEKGHSNSRGQHIPRTSCQLNKSPTPHTCQHLYNYPGLLNVQSYVKPDTVGPLGCNMSSPWMNAEH